MDDHALRERIHSAAEVGTVPRVDRMSVERRGRTLRRRRALSFGVGVAIALTAVAIPLRALSPLGDGRAPVSDPVHAVDGVSISAPAAWQQVLEYDPGIPGVRFEATNPPLTRNAGNRDVGVIHLRQPGFQTAFLALSGRELAVGVAEVTSLCPCDGERTAPGPVSFSANDWYRATPPGSDRLSRIYQTHGYLRIVRIAGRSFVIWATVPERPATARQLAKINGILATLQVGDAEAPPTTDVGVRFPPRDQEGGSWFDRNRASALTMTVRPSTEDVVGYALAGQLDPTPVATLIDLPDDQIVVAAERWPRGAGETAPPFQVPQLASMTPDRRYEFNRNTDLPRWRYQGAVGQDLVQVTVWIGGRRPSPAAIERAQGILDGLIVAGLPSTG